MTDYNWNIHSIPTRRSSDLGRGSKYDSVPIIAPSRMVKSSSTRILPKTPSTSHCVTTTLPSDTCFMIFIFSIRSEEHTSELQSRENIVCRLLLEKKKYIMKI